MSLSKYSSSINLSIFIFDVLDFKVPENSVICSVVGDLVDYEYPFISAINNIRGAVVSPINKRTVSDTHSYYKDIIISMCNIVGKNCTDSVLDILAAYIFPTRVVSSDDVEDVLRLLESVIDIEIDSDDELWYIRETVRYKLLNMYTRYGAVDNIDKIRELMSVVKSNKEKYDRINTAIEHAN